MSLISFYLFILFMVIFSLDNTINLFSTKELNATEQLNAMQWNVWTSRRQYNVWRPIKLVEVPRAVWLCVIACRLGNRSRDIDICFQYSR